MLEEMRAEMRAENGATRNELWVALNEMRSELGTAIAATRNELGVAIEAVHHRVDFVAEAVVVVDEKVDRHAAQFTETLERTTADTHALIRFSYADLDGRVRVLEQ